MNRRGVLKALAFIVGLYFVLEFLLPEKVGGDFDSYEVHSPALVHTARETLIFYVGQYRKEIGAVGRLVADGAAPGGWRRLPDKPVMQRSLFIPHDRWGMSQLDAVAAGSDLYLLYIGRNREQVPVLCYAASADNGLSWKKMGPVLMAAGGVPHPTIEEPNGKLPGDLDFFSAEYQDNAWLFHLVLSTKAHGRSVWRATGTDLKALVIASEPVLSGDQTPQDSAAFDAYQTGQGEMLYFVSGPALVSLQVKDGVVSRAEDSISFPTNHGNVADLRVDPATGTMCVGAEQLRGKALPAEMSVCETRLYTQPLAPGADARASVIKTVGKPAIPTYLSRGTKLAGEYLEILGSFAIFIAMINLVIFHGKRIVQRQKNSYNSIVFLCFLVTMAVHALLGTPIEAEGTYWKKGFDFLFKSIQLPMGAAVFSMITFYMISAAYRSFKMRTADAALLMLSAMIVMVGQMPIGQWLATPVPDYLAVFKLPWLAQKLLTVVNAAAYRGVLIGILVGELAISLRVWLGMDESVYAGVE